MISALLLFVFQAYAVYANTEKVVFLGPSSLEVPLEPPMLQDLQLEALSPKLPSIRTHIEAEFPSDVSRYGQSTWLLLRGLREGQRYEVRICWAAIVHPECHFE